MTKLNVRLTMLVDGDGLKMEVRCDKSNIVFFEVNVPAKKFCQLLGRLAEVKAVADVRRLGDVGKTMEMDQLIFELPKCDYHNRKEVAIKEAMERCPEGWKPDEYFGSQNSFFRKDNKEMAQTTIRRWV